MSGEQRSPYPSLGSQHSAPLATAPKVHSLPHPPPGEYGECVCQCYACVDPDTGKCRCVECCMLPAEKP